MSQVAVGPSSGVVLPLRRAAVARALADRQAGAELEVTRILEGAYRMIRRDGVVEPGVRELLAEVGLSNRSFYRHFATKDEFLLVLLEDIQGRLTADLAARMAVHAQPQARIRAWVLGVLDQAVDPATATLGRPFLVHGPRLQEAYPDVYRATGAELLGLLEGAIRDAVADGRVVSADPHGDARAIFHLVFSVMQSHVLGRTAPATSEQEALLDFAVRALR
jgi:AcrR family transcriptional regulator